MTANNATEPPASSLTALIAPMPPPPFDEPPAVVARRPAMENLGIAAFVVSLIFWISPLAIPLGIYAIRKMTRRAAGAPRVLAYLAVICGCLSTVLWGVIFLAALGRRSQ